MLQVHHTEMGNINSTYWLQMKYLIETFMQIMLLDYDFLNFESETNSYKYPLINCQNCNHPFLSWFGGRQNVHLIKNNNWNRNCFSQLLYFETTSTSSPKNLFYWNFDHSTCLSYNKTYEHEVISSNTHPLRRSFIVLLLSLCLIRCICICICICIRSK